MSHKVLFILKKRLNSYGKSVGLSNSARFVSDYLISKGFESKLIEVQDSNDIDREVTKYNPTHVVIEALWVPPYKFRELLKIQRHQCREWIVRIHSKLPFLANEGNAIESIKSYFEIQKYHQNLKVSFNVEDLNWYFSNLYQGECVYLPNIYYSFKHQKQENLEKDYIDIGCFGAIRPMKNHLIQAVAAIEFGNVIGQNIKFHINADRIEQKGEEVLKNLRALFKDIQHQLIEHSWMNHEEFIQLVQQMDFGTQISLSESYNIVTADFVSNNIPVVVSKDIEWMPEFTKVNPNSLQDIVQKYCEIYHYNYFNWINKLSKCSLNNFNKMAKKAWLSHLK